MASARSKYRPGRMPRPPRGCRFDEAAAQRVVDFIQCLKHTRGKWAGKPFTLLAWQEKIVRDIFGWKKSNGRRLYKWVYIEIPKKNGKSELGAAIALYLTFGDGEPGPEVYSAATDRKNCRPVFLPALQMFRWEPGLHETEYGDLRGRDFESTYRIVNYELGGYYEVLSSEAYSKHGYNVHGVIFDELHAQPTRALYDVLTEGSGDAREQPLYVFLTTAGTDRNSVCWEVHEKARRILIGTAVDPEFYAVIFGLSDEEDEAESEAWEKESTWRRCNPSLGHIIEIETVRNHYRQAKENPIKENNFRQLRLNQWVKSSLKPIPLRAWDACGGRFKPELLEELDCYGGMDLSSHIDLTSLGLVFPDGKGEYYSLHWFWIPEATMLEAEKRDKVPYRSWVKRGLVKATPGNVVDYAYILAELDEIRQRYRLKELAYDRWKASLLVQQLEEKGFAVDEKESGTGHPLLVEFGQGFKSMSPPTKELVTLAMQKKLHHGGNPVLRWNIDNLVLKVDEAENMKPDKAKSTQRIDGAVAMIMALDRAIKHEGKGGPSIYETRGVLAF